MPEFLSTVLEYKRQILAQKKDFYAGLKKKIQATQPTGRPRAFKEQISRPGQINLIAEIKKASPSAGVLRKDFHIEAIAKIYAEHKAAAISVLTEDKYFLGSPEDVKAVASCIALPVLAKDFIISDGQIYEARANGAAAVLLIAAILDDAQLKDFLALAQSLGLDSLVEIHDEKELDRALAAAAELIGVNNRDLKNLEVNLKTAQHLIPRIPKGKIIVAESGIRTRDDVRRLQDLGVHAVLIGETFMRASDIGKKIEEIMRG